METESSIGDGVGDGDGAAEGTKEGAERGVAAEAEEKLGAVLGLPTGVAEAEGEDHLTGDEVVGNAEVGAGSEATPGLMAEEAPQTARYIRRGPPRGSSNSRKSISLNRRPRNSNLTMGANLNGRPRSRLIREDKEEGNGCIHLGPRRSSKRQ